ncbi:hypothetical protein BDZ85DRAFT_62106 [Elsinoe ampelina]|uniref:Uncharacterized protein n=1 Tax=Elsinoe ampelina TaxID=302913 RepID=A0A6A6FZQ7_9PEZI|nr:hypothetical protein BDZ85DRAFT_62106 [Elsinoe ampelina]
MLLVQPDPYMLVIGVAVAVFTPYTYCIFKYGQYVIDTAQEIWAEIFDFQLDEEHYPWMFKDEDDKPDLNSDRASDMVDSGSHNQSAATMTPSKAIIELEEPNADDESSDTSSPKKNIKPDTSWAADVYPLAGGDESPTRELRVRSTLRRTTIDRNSTKQDQLEQEKSEHDPTTNNEDYEKLSHGSDHESTDEEWEKSWWTNKPLRRV